MLNSWQPILTKKTAIFFLPTASRRRRNESKFWMQAAEGQVHYLVMDALWAAKFV
jgi:hypothetical protein